MPDVAVRVNKPSYLVWSDPATAEVYRQLLRKSLFFGLSDGARIDDFRRATAGIVSNEQVLLATEIAREKWNQVLEDLRKALNDQAARFKFIFLLDDFIGTGTTLQGKLKRFWRDCQQIVDSHFDPEWTMVVHHYVATAAVTTLIVERAEELRQAQGENGWFRQVEFTFELVLPESPKVDEQKAGAFGH